MAVTGQELSDAERPGAVIRAQHYHVSKSARDQLDPAQDEGPHHYVAQLAVGLHQGKQTFAFYFYHLRRLGRVYPGEPSPAGKQTCFTGEHARFANREEIRAR